ncbi:MAG: glycosyltransferase family 39 protein [Anaerolineae bacterium]|nr:glycosyltransferase family 39 protein [Anaerolineae bacterium]
MGRQNGLALGAAAWLVLNPQFVASHAGVSNDPLTNALCAVFMLGLLRLVRGEAPWWHWAVLGVVVGLGALTKQSALMLLPLGGLGALLSASARRNAFGAGKMRLGKAGLLSGVGRAVAFGAVAVLIGGGWYLANSVRYGDPLGVAPHFGIQVALGRFGWQASLSTLQSYWGAFGWALITAPWWAYLPFGMAVGLGLAGGAKALVPGGAFWTQSGLVRRALGLLGLALAMNLVAFVRWATATGAPYGRLLFPTAGAAGIILAWGLAQWRSAGCRCLVVALSGCACLAVVLLPWTLLRPALGSPYLPRGVPESATVVADVRTAHVRLAGYEIAAETFELGDRLNGSLYWRAEAVQSTGPGRSEAGRSEAGISEAGGERLTLSAQLRGLDPTARLADDTRWLGGTLYPSDRWQVGDVVEHEVALQIPDWAPVPALIWLDLKLLAEDGALLAFEPGGGDTTTLGPWRVQGAVEIPKTATHVDVSLGTAIRLEAYEARQDVEVLLVDLYWRSEAAPEANYTVFLHGVDAGGVLVAQDDGPPAGGAYPTSWWLTGDVIRDRRTIPIGAPLATQTLRVGMYVPATGERLRAVDANGVRLPDDAVPLPVRK